MSRVEQMEKDSRSKKDLNGEPDPNLSRRVEK